MESDVEEGGEEVVFQESEEDEIEAFADFLRYHVVVEPGDKYSDLRDEAAPAREGEI